MPLVFLLVLGGCFGSATSDGSPGEVGGTSESAPEPECDPQTQRSFCDAGDLIECAADGTFEVSGCGTDSLCAEGSEGADCVWRLGLPCERDVYPTCWDPGGVLSCTEGFWSFEGCSTSELCKERFGDAACISEDEVDCEYGDFVPRCEGDTLVECGAYEVETMTACEPGTRCETTLAGVACIDDDSTPCDPDELSGRCIDETEVELCDTTTGWTQRFTCPDDDQCLPTVSAAGCFGPDAETCDPNAVEPTCTDEVARGCTSFGITYAHACTDEQRCAIDETCLFGCGPFATCVELDAEPCDEPLDTFCGDETIEICFDGSQVGGFPCLECVEGEDGATCA